MTSGIVMFWLFLSIYVEDFSAIRSNMFVTNQCRKDTVYRFLGLLRYIFGLDIGIIERDTYAYLSQNIFHSSTRSSKYVIINFV